MSRAITLDFRPQSARGGRLRLRTDMARLTSGRFAAIQVDAGPNHRQFVVATDDETARGWIPEDGRQRFDGLHEAYDVAHGLAVRARRLSLAA